MGGALGTTPLTAFPPPPHPRGDLVNCPPLGVHRAGGSDPDIMSPTAPATATTSSGPASAFPTPME